MAQISRPFQIAFAAMALFALVWLLALRGHSSAPSEPGSAAPASSPSPAASGGVVHGTAPGVEGLARAVAKAHGAVTTSQQNAKQLQERSAQASGETASASAGGTSAPRASTPTAAKTAPSTAAASSSHAAAPAVKPSHSAAPKPSRPSAKTPAASTTSPSMQLKVEAELKQGKTVAILFWNPKATDDQAVSHQLQSVAHKLHTSVAVHAALASQVGAFGTIIRGVKVYGTPTVMIINKRGQALTLTGYTDAYAIEQAISEARHAQHR